MKCILILFVSFAFTLNAVAGKIESTVLQKDQNGNWFYEKVINVENVNKKDLYNKMKKWIVANIKTVDNNIMYDDINYETIVTTPTVAIENTKHNWLTNQSMNFKLSIAFKDNKLKIIANSFFYSGVGGGTTGGSLENFEIAKAYLKDLNPKFDSAFKGFVEALTQAASSKNGDW